MTKDQPKGGIDLDEFMDEFKMSEHVERNREMIESVDCPSEEELNAFLDGTSLADREREIVAHMLGGDRCGEAMRRLRDGGLPYELWEHPSDALLFAYLVDAIPAGPLGDALRAQTADHLKLCSVCRAKVEGLALDLVEWREAARDEAHAAWLQGLLAGLLAATHRRRAEIESGHYPRGVARGDSGELTALLLDREGEARLDPEGQAESALFTLLEAKIDGDGELFVRLLTDDARCVAASGRPARLRVLLRHAGRHLRFDPIPIRPAEPQGLRRSGVVILREKLGIETEPQEIPPEALLLMVEDSDEEGDRGGDA